MKFLGGLATGVGAVLVAVAAVFVAAASVAVLCGWPVMLVLGALHLSSGLAAVPALGFWQTLGGLYLLSVVGGSFRSWNK